MAKVDTAEKADKGKKKKKSSAAEAGGKVKKAKPAKAPKAAKSDGAKKGSRRAEGFDGLAKFVDHPLVADLLAAGALAAVAAIAEHKMGDGKESSSKMVKSVGKAAATAMGRRLMGDLGTIATAATAAAKKA